MKQQLEAIRVKALEAIGGAEKAEDLGRCACSTSARRAS